MTHLLNNLEKLKKAQVEIDKLLKQERLLQESDLSNLFYLECVIKEIYRLYPGGPLLLPRENSKECTFAGYNIPKGTMLLVNAYAIQRDMSTWKVANEFMPEQHMVLASTVGISRFCDVSVVGFHFEEELLQLPEVKEITRQPYIAIIGSGSLGTSSQWCCSLHNTSSSRSTEVMCLSNYIQYEEAVGGMKFHLRQQVVHSGRHLQLYQ